MLSPVGDEPQNRFSLKAAHADRPFSFRDPFSLTARTADASCCRIDRLRHRRGDLDGRRLLDGGTDAPLVVRSVARSPGNAGPDAARDCDLRGWCSTKLVTRVGHL